MFVPGNQLIGVGVAARLTTLAVEKAKANPAGRVEMPDAALPGLYLVIQPSGEKNWALRTRIRGKTTKLTLGVYPALELGDARERARTKLELIDKGHDPRELERAEAAARAATEAHAMARHRTTVEATAGEWLRRDQAGNRTVAEVRRYFEREVLPSWGDRQITDIRKRDVIELVEHMADRAPTPANRLLAYVKRYLAWAAARDLIEANPAQPVEKPANERRRNRVLASDELVVVWQDLEGMVWPYATGVRLPALTGARLGGIFEARWSALDLSGASLRLPADRAKNSQPRSIPLSRSALAIVGQLSRIGDDDGFLLSLSGNLPYSNFGRVKAMLDLSIARACAHAFSSSDPDEAALRTHALPAWRIHDIRRTVATGLQRLGVRLEVIEAVLGHVSGSRAGIVGVYQRHSFEVEARQALETWGREVGISIKRQPFATNFMEHELKRAAQYSWQYD